MSRSLAIILVLLGIFIAGTECANIWRGYESRVSWGNNHGLMNNRNVPRSLEYRIDFPATMKKVPQIMINPNLYDWEWGFPVDWHIEVNRVDRNGFFYKVTTNSAKGMYSLFFNWLAVVNEETLQIKYLNNVKTPNMKAGSNPDRIKVSFDYVFDEAPFVWASFIGFNMFDGSQFYLERSVENVDEQGFTLVLSNGGVTKVEWVSLAIMAVSKDRAYSVIKKVTDKDVPQWSSRSPGEWKRYEDLYINNDYRKKGNIPEPFNSPAQFAYSKDRNMRLECQRDVYDVNNFMQRARFGTWWDSILYSMTYEMYVYVPSPERCAKFYSECNFNGEELFQICEDTPENKAIAGDLHGYDVKSFKVPKGLSLKIFPKENFEG